MDVYQRRRLVALSALAALFVIFVLLIKGCGDDSSDPVTTTPLAAGATGVTGAVPTIDAYIQQADDICLQANTVVAGLDGADAQQDAIDEANAVKGELEQLQTLPLPGDKADEVGAFVEALSKQSENLNDRVVAYENGDTAAVSELDATIDEESSDVSKAAKKVGLEVCGDPEAVGETTTSGESSSSEESSDTAAATDAPATDTSVEPTAPVTPAPAPVTDTATDGGVATEPAAPATEAPSTDTSSGGVSP